MKHLFSLGRTQLIVAVSLANFSLPVLRAASRCPGSAASLIPRFVQHALVVVPVRAARHISGRSGTLSFGGQVA
jgi:hypothetical protein